MPRRLRRSRSATPTRSATERGYRGTKKSARAAALSEARRDFLACSGFFDSKLLLYQVVHNQRENDDKTENVRRV
jgi:hypothetical protein